MIASLSIQEWSAHALTLPTFDPIKMIESVCFILL